MRARIFALLIGTLLIALDFVTELRAQWVCVLGEYLGLGRGHIAVREHNRATKRGRQRCLRCGRVKEMPW